MWLIIREAVMDEKKEKTQKQISNDQIKTDSCQFCGKVGTPEELEDHIDVVKRNIKSK
ncbi:MAG: hypothetical protein NZM44_02930 [Candidatus Calescibacterium sp.]|nr:hypothetical protein [Candidatus Calescibacterium sp.]